MNALIIDDNEMTRTVLRAMLVRSGLQVIGEASNGNNGYELIMKLKPQVVCLDIVMPDISGIDVLKQLRAELDKMIVLMVSGERNVDTIKQCLSLGASGFIIKPFNESTVLKSLRDAALRAGMTMPDGL
ncbi:response regulator [Actimicrobium sp. CCC2.4]|uniref:response regulator n=1 Tax=Actimicrobium sp. CCC2.4 TaxID=3048606 RepID=UPI002AC9A26D|nr:response regulator [Actimicrobium sp. CCC2.4]MEB0136637.1 response regulator [Actimicrobium sp. CCC2.4]WPX31679.1 response regulator [Actimicrobium sp. CCC2.4]